MFSLDGWFGNLNLLIQCMLDDGVPNTSVASATASQAAPNGDNGKMMEREVHRFEDEGGPPSPPQPL